MYRFRPFYLFAPLLFWATVLPASIWYEVDTFHRAVRLGGTDAGIWISQALATSGVVFSAFIFPLVSWRSWLILDVDAIRMCNGFRTRTLRADQIGSYAFISTHPAVPAACFLYGHNKKTLMTLSGAFDGHEELHQWLDQKVGARQDVPKRPIADSLPAGHVPRHLWLHWDTARAYQAGQVGEEELLERVRHRLAVFVGAACVLLFVGVPIGLLAEGRTTDHVLRVSGVWAFFVAMLGSLLIWLPWIQAPQTVQEIVKTRRA